MVENCLWRADHSLASRDQEIHGGGSMMPNLRIYCQGVKTGLASRMAYRGGVGT